MPHTSVLGFFYLPHTSVFYQNIFSELRTPIQTNIETELKQTSVLKMPIDSASAKISAGQPEDEDEDYALNYWAGIIPINQSFGEPKDDPKLKKGIEMPEYLKNYCRD